MIKWGLVVHTVAMFSNITIPAVMRLNLQYVCYIEYPGFPGDAVSPAGPLGCQILGIINLHRAYFRSMFPLNQWLADGFLVGSVPNSRLGT